MRRETFWLLAPVVVAAAVVFVIHGGEIQRADYFLFQVIGIAFALWILLGIGRSIRNRQRK